jgi:hypothetical protein
MLELVTLESVTLVGVATALMSAVFWGLGAGIRIPPISLFYWWRRPDGDHDPTTAALRRQSLMNAFAAIFAALAAICQAILIYAVPG